MVLHHPDVINAPDESHTQYCPVPGCHRPRAKATLPLNFRSCEHPAMNQGPSQLLVTFDAVNHLCALQIRGLYPRYVWMCREAFDLQYNLAFARTMATLPRRLLVTDRSA
ncbi:hypothetical protein SCLCIDRAFT_1217319 [Scleroderma citrinum Foug A]|uniref:Uncharacterized protein n=1 Tax=Scleroderma citrinum Foug A TaxID=1036808 RepID=A0A0C2ZDL6_9AGAM|nr:hypothetical protein SCLCIDRAFT_1217319 [Scleroderma citrinum Foug A]